MTNLAIFASGRGSNAEAIINYFRGSADVKVALIVTNNPEAGVIEVANREDIPLTLITRKGFYESKELLNILEQYEVGFIALAGFLWLVPQYLLEAYPNKMVNVHPALLPKHGGKGMYGKKVHEAVLQAKDTETGITIHYVNEHFDEGEIIFSASCKTEPTDTVESIEKKVRKLELEYYPKALEQLLSASKRAASTPLSMT